MKKRIGIIVIYNKDGKIEAYVKYLLESLRNCLSYFIVVINGYLRDEELDKVRAFSDEIFIRENLGYDGGAYKETLLRLISEGTLSEFDELLLCNDSFYGPLIPWEHIFETMENEHADFWGLSKWLEGESSMPGYPRLPEHIQAYFLVITSPVFQSEHFRRFWAEMEMPSSYDEAIRNFEIAFTTYFYNCGFCYQTWMEAAGGSQYLERGQVVYCSHMADLVEKCRFPVIKRKAVSLPAFEQYLRVLQYVKENGNYKSEFLEEGWRQYEKTEFPYDDLEGFYDRHEKIYVFGYGKWGKALECYFNYKAWNIEGFIVSKGNKTDRHLFCIEDLQMCDNVGIIVALGEKNGKEVVPVLRRKVREEHLLIPEGLLLPENNNRRELAY